MLRDALSWFTKVKLEAGYVVVLETAGRSGHWNPHLHILKILQAFVVSKVRPPVQRFNFVIPQNFQTDSRRAHALSPPRLLQGHGSPSV
jgi:hypothetical protein